MTMCQTPAIAISDLVKSYGPHVAVDHVSFQVFHGEVFALLGPNGAGKTTTVEILEGYRTADAGVVRVLGLDPGRDRHRLMERVGLMLQADGIYPRIRVREVFELYARLYTTTTGIEALLQTVGLEQMQKATYRSLSRGQQQRLALGLALIGEPEVVFLDEPTAGMDPHARRGTWDIVKALKGRGATVFLTTHFMDEAEELADHVAIMDAGRLIALGTPEALKRAGSSEVVTLTVHDPLELDQLRYLPSAVSARQDTTGTYLIETEHPGNLLVELSTFLQRLEIVPERIQVGHGSLEQVFLNLTTATDTHDSPR